MSACLSSSLPSLLLSLSLSLSLCLSLSLSPPAPPLLLILESDTPVDSIDQEARQPLHMLASLSRCSGPLCVFLPPSTSPCAARRRGDSTQTTGQTAAICGHHSDPDTKSHKRANVIYNDSPPSFQICLQMINHIFLFVCNRCV